MNKIMLALVVIIPCLLAGVTRTVSLDRTQQYTVIQTAINEAVSHCVSAETIGSNTKTTEQDSLSSLKSILPSVDLHKYYDLLPGDEKWKDLKNFYEMIQAVQIKDDVLPTITNEELLDLVLFNPFMMLKDSYDNPIYIFNLLPRFNSYNELIIRKDAYPLIANKFINCDVSQLDSIYVIGRNQNNFMGVKCNYAIQVNRYLLSHNEILNELSDSLLIRLMEKSIAEYDTLDNMNKYSDIQNFDTYLMYKIMQKYNYEPLINQQKTDESLKKYDSLFLTATKSDKQKIVEHAIEFLKSRK